MWNDEAATVRKAILPGLLVVMLACLSWETPSCHGQEVRSRSSSETSEFLRPPGTQSYDEPTDWGQVPRWRQGSFFGVRAHGRFFVFVVDCSGSMLDEARLARAKSELRRSVNALRWPQKFLVIFYNDRPLPQPGGLPRPAQLDSKARLLRWLHTVDAQGGTDPRAAMSYALGMRPDAVFLLSDGAFPEGAVAAISESNPRKVPIHCIDLAGGAAGLDLKSIAAASGGTYASRP